jgi:uncharacterized membrane protein YuzA (DUF378 family)
MLLAWMQVLEAQQAQAYPSYFNAVVLLLLVIGALGWLVACVLGFTRARACGPAARWFALASACMLLFHLHIVLIGIASASGAGSAAVALTAFVFLFVVLAAVCAILGFTRCTNTEELEP